MLAKFLLICKVHVLCNKYVSQVSRRLQEACSRRQHRIPFGLGLRRSPRDGQPWTPSGPEGSSGNGGAGRRGVAGVDLSIF